MMKDHVSGEICADAKGRFLHAPMVSVIMPVYNAGSYLREALDSLLGQRQFRDFEILCVNDGSTDNSRAILCDYAARDPRIRIFDQENDGPGAARNTGTDAASGKYLYYMDADDLLEPDALALLTREMEKESLDYLCFNATTFTEDATKQAASGKSRISFSNAEHDVKEGDVLSGQQLFRELNPNPGVTHLNAPAWGCMVSRRHILKNRIRFPTDPRIVTEDRTWSFAALIRAERAGCLNRSLYRYRIREDSRVHGINRFSRVHNYFFCALEMQRTLVAPDFICEAGMEKLLSAYIRSMQEVAVKNYLACSVEEKQKLRDLPLEDAIQFECLVVCPAEASDKEGGWVGLLRRVRRWLKKRIKSWVR